jgi:aldehyde:ferredoxin oxidoreductase
MLGANCGLSDEEVIPRLASRCNEAGLDIITMGNILGFLMDLGERGRLPEGFLDRTADLGGRDLTWGDWRAMESLIDRVAQRAGAGEVISRGVAILADELGHGVDAFAFHSKGHELAAWNPKGSSPMALSYATASRGACHLTGQTVVGQDRQAMNDSVGGCYFVRRLTDYGLLARLVSAVLGRELDSEALHRVGDRTINLEKCFNWREGFTAADDRRIPRALASEPVPPGDGAEPHFTTASFEAALTSYYRRRGWDAETSRPLRPTLERLGLGFAADDLEAS